MTFNDSWIANGESALARFEGFLSEVGAADVSATHMSILAPVARTRDLNPSPEEVAALAAPFQRLGLTVAVRGGQRDARIFAYRTESSGMEPPFGAFMWLPIHSGLAAWWLLTAWRCRQMSEASLAMMRQQLPLPAAACARSLLETAAVARYDVNRWTAMWQDCRRFSPSLGEIVPSSLYHPFHNYVVEMLVGGKFKGEMPLDVRALYSEPLNRTNIQTCMDHLAKKEPRVGLMYDVLCNAVHPSVASTITFMTGVEAPYPGEGRVSFAREGGGVSPISGKAVSTLSSTADAMEFATQIALETLDESLRTLDDLCLTTRIGVYKQATHWRTLKPAGRNERCPCRSGRKAKECPHEWGSEDAGELQEAAIRSRRPPSPK
jgi:hypothetical protein